MNLELHRGPIRMPTLPRSLHPTKSSGLAVAVCIVPANGAVAPEATKRFQIKSGLGIVGALELYSRASAARGTEAFIGRYAGKTDFHLVTLSSSPVRFNEEPRAAFDAQFVSHPDYRSIVRQGRSGDDFAVVEYDVHLNPDRSAREGGRDFALSSETYRTPTSGISVFESGRVREKIIHSDTDAIRTNSAKVEHIEK
jgi:hypothetical protein